jgi:hypothetical protein
MGFSGCCFDIFCGVFGSCYLSESGFLGLWDFRDVVDIFFVWCLGVVICQNQDIWLLSEVEVQDLRIYRILFRQ